MKVLITGGAGYIGTSLISRLQDSGYEVTVFDSMLHGGDALLPFFNDVNFHFINGDMRDARAVRDAVKGQDVIVHLAALVGVPACQNAVHTERINVGGTKNLLRAIGVAHNRRLIYASTVSVYGKSATKACLETSIPDPQSNYGKTKCAAELLMQQAGATSLRFGTVFGLSPRMRLDLVVNELTYMAVKQGSMTLYEPAFVRPWVSVRDAARSIVWAVDTYQVGRVFNVVGENLTKGAVAHTIKGLTRAKIVKGYGTDTDMRDYAVHADRIKYAGFTFSETVYQGVEKMVKAFAAIQKTPWHVNA